MLKEIFEQPTSLANTTRGRLVEGGITLNSIRVRSSAPFLVVPLFGLVLPQEHLDTIRTSRRIIFVACGTSAHSGFAVRGLMEELTGIPVTCENGSDFLVSHSSNHSSNTLLTAADRIEKHRYFVRTPVCSSRNLERLLMFFAH